MIQKLIYTNKIYKPYGWAVQKSKIVNFRFTGKHYLSVWSFNWPCLTINTNNSAKDNNINTL